MEPPLEPMTRSGLMPASSSPLSTPMCAKPRGPPDPSTRAARGAGPCGGSKRGRRSFGTSPMLQPAMPSARPARRMNGGALMLVAVFARLLLPALDERRTLRVFHVDALALGVDLVEAARVLQPVELAPGRAAARASHLLLPLLHFAVRGLLESRQRRATKEAADSEVQKREQQMRGSRWEQEARKYCD